ncbi:hypothetical protein [Pseudomonas putida]|uniref:hypothetical protein n=1 Tax=Pseudomonas putida TaxID=303 RepID=UPI003D973A11
MKFSDCQYDAYGAIVCVFRGLPFQISEADTPDEWLEIQALIGAGEVVVDSYFPPPKPSKEEMEAREDVDGRARGNVELNATDFLVTRHRDQMDKGGETTLTVDEYNHWLLYRQKLRDITSQEGAAFR